MLLQAETALHELNTKYIQVSKKAQLG